MVNRPDDYYELFCARCKLIWATSLETFAETAEEVRHQYCHANPAAGAFSEHDLAITARSGTVSRTTQLKIKKVPLEMELVW